MGKLRLTTTAEKTVTIALVIFGLATLIGMILMWPSDKSVTVDDTLKQSIGMNDSLVYGKAIEEGQTSCDNVLFGRPMNVQPHFPEGSSSTSKGGTVKGQCPAVVIEIHTGENASQYVVLNNRVVGDSVMVKPGDHIRMAQDKSAGNTRYVFEDMDRRTSLAIWLGVTVLIVLLAGSWKGLRAVIGVVVTLAVVVLWMLPSILSGHPVILVAVCGSSLALFLVMFFVHGFSWKTASALLGTLISLLAAVTMSQLAVQTTHITGMSEEQNVTMQMYMGQLPVVGLVIAGFIIGTIGVLNDVTISQAATVYELAEMDPDASASRVFSGAMRVGRDHISSMLYTLVLAYTGSVLPLLLLIQQSSRGMWEVLNGEVIAVEILRSVVGAITLALSFPLTNAIATWLAVPRQRGHVDTTDPVAEGAPANPIVEPDNDLTHPIPVPLESGEEEIVEAEIVQPSGGGYLRHDNYHRPADPHTRVMDAPSRGRDPYAPPLATPYGRPSETVRSAERPSRPADGYPRPQGGFQRVGDGHLVTGDGYLTSGDRGYASYTAPGGDSPSYPTGTAPTSPTASAPVHPTVPPTVNVTEHDTTTPTVSNYQPRRARPAGSDGDAYGFRPSAGRYTTGHDNGDAGDVSRHGRHSR